MDTPDRKAEALSFLKFQDLGVLATATPEDGPSARAVYYAADDQFNVYFLTFKNTRKSADLSKSSRAAFAVFDRTTPATIQLEGTVTDLTDSAVIDPIVTELAERIAAKGDHFAPPTRLDPSAVRFYRLSPSWIRYGNFSAGTGSDEVFVEIPAQA